MYMTSLQPYVSFTTDETIYYLPKVLIILAVTHKRVDKASPYKDAIERINTGQTVNIDYREGLLNIPWYYLLSARSITHILYQSLYALRALRSSVFFAANISRRSTLFSLSETHLR